MPVRPGAKSRVKSFQANVDPPDRPTPTFSLDGNSPYSGYSPTNFSHSNVNSGVDAGSNNGKHRSASLDNELSLNTTPENSGEFSTRSSGTTVNNIGEYSDLSARKSRNVANVDKFKEDIIRGHFPTDFPRITKIVRTYLSSAFTDTKEETTALVLTVYPKLRQFCRERGYEFQVVDMRWGVRDEVTDDHTTSELCLREIRKCQRLSTGPNFVTFLSQKYGFRPMPSKIKAEEFEAILKNVETTSDQKFLLEWYMRDDNAIPPRYQLRSIRSKIPNYTNKENPEKQQKAQQKWLKAMERMQGILRKSVQNCLEPENARKYFWSGSEEEIQAGILDVPDVDGATHWFTRTLTDLEVNCHSKMAPQFMDINNGIDVEPNLLLTKLKEDRLRKKLIGDNVSAYRVKWTYNGIDPNYPEHKSYLDQFCKDFDSTVRKLTEKGIRTNIADYDQQPIRDSIVHLQLAQDKSNTFRGRKLLLGDVKDRVLKNIKLRLPLVLLGKKGCGKSALIAKCTELLSDWLTDSPPIIVRFLGITAVTSNTRDLLTNLCLHISHLTGIELNIPHGLQELKSYFVTEVLPFCHKAAINGKLFILLDSVDQLFDHGAGLKDWIPATLPEGVFIIVSAVSDTNSQVYRELQETLPEECFYSIPPLNTDDIQTILNSWFLEEKRTLQDGQMVALTTACRQCRLPLYLKVAFDEACHWNSKLPGDILQLSNAVEDLIQALLNGVEKYHGESLVSHSLAYITASKTGLSQSELEDILSCDDIVLNDVIPYHQPPLRRLPPALWVRVQADLRDYIVCTSPDGFPLLTWCHQQFRDVARERYLDEINDRTTTHTALADYFLGTWVDWKPYYDSDGNSHEADRIVPTQPLVFKETEEKTVFNLRKMIELPFHLTLSDKLELLKDVVLCNFSWIYEKTRALGLHSVLDDYEFAQLHGITDNDIERTGRCLEMSKNAIISDPKQISRQLQQRLADSDGPVIQRLLTQARRHQYS